ncbi:MAG TPA: Ig-like domain-containing protein [Gammaproteobacteria bacterium]
MRKLKLLLATAALALIGGCSGSDNTLTIDPATLADPAVVEAVIATLTLLTSDPGINSDGSETATITALARDADNNVMEDIAVSFSADSGSLVITQPAVTGPNGTLTAALTPGGDPANRSITVTATAGETTATITVAVVGTKIEILGSPSLPVGQSSNYVVVVTDAGGNPLTNVSVNVSSLLGNGVNPSTVTTGLDGQASFTLTANNAGSDALTAAALGATSAPRNVTMSADAFSFIAPAPDPVPEIPLNTDQSVTVNWQSGGVPVNGQPVSFTTTRGTVVPNNIPTVSGNATVDISATNAGPAVITATNTDGTTTQLEVEFVATVPATLELQGSPLNIGTTEQSAITATVRDASGNLVKNQIIDFSLTDITGGSLSVGQAVTDSAGQAQTFYTASTATSATEGVRIDATVQGTAITDFVQLTVAQRELFVSIGTGNEIFEPNPAQYRVPYVIQVTDAQGNGVAGARVQVAVLSVTYYKGFRIFPLGASSWSTQYTATCADEDINRNGILDAGEDFNASGRIEAGNIASISAQNTGGGTLTTDANGFGFADLFYPQEYAYYVDTILQATVADVSGTEFAEALNVTLTGSAADFNNQNIAPPGPVSPFGSGGVAPTCADTL